MSGSHERSFTVHSQVMKLALTMRGCWGGACEGVKMGGGFTQHVLAAGEASGGSRASVGTGPSTGGVQFAQAFWGAAVGSVS